EDSRFDDMPETNCPICQEYLTDPVTIQCGHNFCWVCITQHCETWAEQDSDLLCCPSCRARIQKGALRKNNQLANIVEKIKQLDFKPGNTNLCERHGKALDLFCDEDGEAVCVVCERSPEHRSHPVLLLDEAAQKYKSQLSEILGFSKKFSLLHNQLSVKGPRAPSMFLSNLFPILIQKQTQTERQKIVSEFQQLRQFLEEQERLLLARLEKLDEEIVRLQNENVRKLSEQISRLSELISELEGKCQKPASEFLQDRGSSLVSRPVPAITGLLGNTAHPNLILSEDRKSVRWEETKQDLPHNPERFGYWPCVLGCEGFTSGRHCWEVEVGDGLSWAVGVARESVGRRRRINLSPEEGIWAVQFGGQFQALTSPVTPLPLSWVPSRIRVCLDCDRGQVTFIDAGDEAPIFTFPPGSIPCERIRPWLWVWVRSQLRLCP
uniref:Uncharacterized protein n=1 Tax=Chelydra serpentina TaxID=8475 RepID=A0A8C3T2J9_CHESE